MSVNTEKFLRRTFPVDAIRVTEENIRHLADWCGGTIAKTLEDRPKLYIALKVEHPSGRREAKAFPGDWLVTTRGGFKVFNDRAFKNTFIHVENVSDEKIGKLVRDAMRNYREARTIDLDCIANEAVYKITKLFQNVTP